MGRLLRFLLLSILCLLAVPHTAFAAKWTFCFYRCGSDLESRGGAATEDLKEILAAAPSDDVDIIIQTGGARQWRNDVVSAKKTTRWK
ncbi:MAG: hypothetical protein MJ061_04410 [Mailhella sp.]|nr:hypothetical protein [Mailhella sp.]